ncbi:MULTISPECIES: DUF6344 domain-containing protein [Streptomyces]|uniref:Secreted protein n=1 Tax=Streptomyces chartreusis NRRL 3882 TaxID=1079985 RepID=A0A2N9BB48_STRCX|nr:MULTISPECIES: DUF6344 domain-containing protein [Streptomyces]MYS91470.1 hypothetical protein [Streptomyces sp. SID5464]SOR80583.1 hypothetical protein SCNRRL3882_4038 [Streptomyces chartreusis NRRL 3882]
MARNKVMKLWTAIVTAFLALCTALGFVTTTAAAAVPQTEQERNSALIPQQRTAPAAAAPRSLSYARALPPTMKQRIHAEAHGKSPSCRHRTLADTTASPTAHCPVDDTEADPADHLTPLQR